MAGDREYDYRGSQLMRFAVSLLVVLIAVTAFFLFGDRRGPSGPGQEAGPMTTAPLGPGPSDPVQPASDPDGGIMDLSVAPLVPAEDLSAVAETGPDREVDVDFTGSDLAAFHGTAWLQPAGQQPYPAVRGTIEIAVLRRGQMVPVTATVAQGRFQVEIPRRCRLRIDGGRLEDQTVRFLGFKKGPFTLDDTADYALVGEPIPLNKLRVFEGTQHVPLAGLSVRIGQDASTALSQGQAPVGEVLMENAASPIELPYLKADHPIWLHVSAEGYATTAVLVDPRESVEKDVVLWPAAAGLTVRVTGPGRAKLKALILHRLEPGTEDGKASMRHFATFGMNTPGITTDPDATIFTLEGLPALPLRLEARGFDERGRDTLIGKAAIELGPNETKTVELRVRDK